ncbi:hypothetical protein C8Q73DRAFT_422164 [Cubamyces lactineus]|nr:hypothetical protein C8Q73DRAFT_422164 [Cubamyces lactineus]
MGLSGRKVKQRIPNDPRNLAWANDANKFGAAYLAKLGWDPSQGLGVSGEGRTTAISVTQKLDLLGIGADHRNSEQGIAWKQNKDFENLLKRLNAANGNGQVGEEGEAMKVDGFVRAGPAAGAETVTSQKEEKEEGGSDGEEKSDKKSKKKRKKGADDEEGEERKKKRKKSKSYDDQSDTEKDKKKDKKKKKKRDASEEPAPPSTSKAEASPAPALAAAPAPQAVVKSKSLRIHRARHMAAKNIASKSASAIAEILGIAPTPSASTSVSGSATPSLPAFSSATTPYPSTPYEPGPSTSASSSSSGVATPANDALKLQDLTVSSKSVMDYFKEKLAAKSNAHSGTSSPAAAPSSQQQTNEDEEMDDYAERPRMGIGASRLRVEVSRAEEADAEEKQQRTGLGGIGSRGGIHSHFAAMFAKSSTTTVMDTMDVAGSQAQVQTETKVEVVEATVREDGPTEESPKKSKDKKEKKEKERKKDKKEKKDKKGKGKEKEVEEQVEDGEAAAEADEKAERKRRKEDRRKQREAEAAKGGAGVDASPDAEGKEGKRKKDKKKSKAES